MESINEDFPNNKLNDNESVQDEPMPETSENGRKCQLLDFPDHVLLFIFKHCSALELKALAFTCQRLNSLVFDHTLWQRVDARSSPTGIERMKWYLTHALSASTTELKVAGFADKLPRCIRENNLNGGTDNPKRSSEDNRSDPQCSASTSTSENGTLKSLKQLALQKISGSAENCAKLTNTHIYSSKGQSKSSKTHSNSSYIRPSTSKVHPNSSKCHTKMSLKELLSSPAWYMEGYGDSLNWNRSDPHYTLNEKLLRLLNMKCQKLTVLALEYCNLDYRNSNLGYFPSTLKKLSLKGSCCYNLPEGYCYLESIKYSLPELECLNLSECDWFTLESLMAVSKCTQLREFYVCRCKGVSGSGSFQYFSLSTKYGFKRLRVLDLRQSPVGDIEISALGWLPNLEELYCSPPTDTKFKYSSDAGRLGDEEFIDGLEPWEIEVPEILKCKSPLPEFMEVDDTKEQDEAAPPNYLHWAFTERRLNSMRSRHFSSYTMCYRTFPQPDPDMFRAGPSKRPSVEERIEVVKRLRSRVQNYRARQRTEGNEPNDADRGPYSDDSDDEQPNFYLHPKHIPVEEKNDDPYIPLEEENDDPYIPLEEENDDPYIHLEEEKDDPFIHLEEENDNPFNDNLEDLLDNPNFPQPGSNELPILACGMPKPNNSVIPQNDDEPIVENANGVEYYEPIPADELEMDARFIEENLEYNHPLPNISPPGIFRNCRHPHMYGGNVDHIIFPEPRVIRFINHEVPHREAETTNSTISDESILNFGRQKEDLIDQLRCAERNDGPVINSNLRILSITGYRDITDRSLNHLISAAPNLRLIDFSQTGVTKDGVENFKEARPNCEVIFSEFKED